MFKYLVTNFLFKAGANMIVAGTAVIQANDQAKVIKVLRDAVNDELGRKLN